MCVRPLEVKRRKSRLYIGPAICAVCKTLGGPQKRLQPLRATFHPRDIFAISCHRRRPLQRTYHRSHGDIRATARAAAVLVVAATGATSSLSARSGGVRRRDYCVPGALPFWDSFRKRVTAQAAMRGVNAAEVGLLCAALSSGRSWWLTSPYQPPHHIRPHCRQGELGALILGEVQYPSPNCANAQRS
jgi:hypothetical protein